MKRDISNTRILVIANKYYDDDPRLQREVRALIEAGYYVDLICPRKKAIKNSEFTDGDNLTLKFYSLKISRKRGSKLRYILEYIIYFSFVSYMTTRLYFKHHHRLIQVFVMPEILLLACLIPKLMGAKILMDWMDPMKEVFLSIYKKKSNLFFLWTIRFFEKCSVALTDHIITPNEGFLKVFVKRGVPKEKISIVMNSADESVFNEERIKSYTSPSKKEFIILYSGTIMPRGGLDIAIRALRLVVRKVPYAHMVIVGDGKPNYITFCRNLAAELEILENIEFRGRVKLQDLPSIIKEGSIGIIPNRMTEFTKINFPTRISEFALLKTPMIVPALNGIMDYMDEKSVCFFVPDSHEDLARCILELYHNPERRRELAENAYSRYEKFRWSKTKKIYLKIVEDLIGEE